MSISIVGQGKVYLIAGGGKTYTDVAAKFCRSEQDVESIIASPQNKAIIRNIIESNHKAALEFDDFIIGVEGFSRVTEVQLVRKRHASYMIHSGRDNKNGKRKHEWVIPNNIDELCGKISIDIDDIVMNGRPLRYYLNPDSIMTLEYQYDTRDLLRMIEDWYDRGVQDKIPEEDLRYMKPQATAFKAAIKMNAAGLRDWFMIRMCNRAQKEINTLATDIYKLVSEASPELFKDAGPSCKVLGYCPETEQCEACKGKIPTKKEVKELINTHYKK